MFTMFTEVDKCTDKRPICLQYPIERRLNRLSFHIYGSYFYTLYLFLCTKEFYVAGKCGFMGFKQNCVLFYLLPSCRDAIIIPRYNILCIL